MKFAPIAAAVIALAAFSAQAQTPAPAAPGSAPMQMHEGRMQQHMQDRAQRRMEGLKRILQITPAQEGAWNTWAVAMKPSPQVMQQRHQLRAELEKMTTPQRIDRMRQLHAERAAAMDKRGDATKTFYAQLSPTQQKAFDEVSLKFMAHHGRGGRGHGRDHHMGA